jgi:hypothetical protein
MIGMFALIIIMNLYMVIYLLNNMLVILSRRKKPLITVQRLIKGVFDVHHNAVFEIN